MLPTVAHATNTNTSNSDSEVTVNVGKSNIVIDIHKVGTNGTAQLIRLEADEYYRNDEYVGMSQNITTNGDIVAEYECGTEDSVTINRYQSDGTDRLYSKYYLIQNNKILAGPFYASEISSLRSVAPFEQASKKGLTLEDESTINTALEMGVSNTVINMDLSTLIITNEDEDGNPIDNSLRSDVIEFESNGEIFYFNSEYVKLQDRLISTYSREGINVTLVVIAWAKTVTSDYPTDLMYLEANQNRHTMAFNTSTERGREYFIAAMEFMASRYTKSADAGLVDKFVIGNEIDYTYDWSLIIPLQDENGKYQRADFDVFMEEYARGLRLANLAVKKYNSEAKVLVSLTHNWAENCLVSYGYKSTNNSNIRYNSYAPKEICDWLIDVEGSRGNYDWGLAVHPYPIGTTSSNPIKTDVNRNDYAHPITGDWETSPWITAANLELYQLYLEQPENMINGEVRSVSLTETSICNVNEDKVSEEEYKIATYEQAASVAMYYYRAANIDCIDQIAYFSEYDQSETGNKLGLRQLDGTAKPSYNVWKYVDTDKSFNYSNQYLKYIDDDAETYQDVMAAVESEYDWDKHWNLDNIICRSVSNGPVNRTISTDKDVYNANDSINVTATGDVGDIVALYLENDDIENSEPIYQFPVSGSENGITFKSGRTYDLVAYGRIGATRTEDAYLKAGKYKIVLWTGLVEETVVKEITIASDYVFGSSSPSLSINKTVYKGGEDVIVTATGNPNGWVGLYKKTDTPKAVTSIYWYYNNYPEEGYISGKPVVMQSTTHNYDSSNPSLRLDEGDYIIYLFGDGGYSSILKSVEFKVEAGEITGLESIQYELDNATDGFANGTVTIKNKADNEDVTDVIMYWADANGNKLEGYNALAKFKIKGETTIHEMTQYTIIPEGAKKLIAYAYDGISLSNDYVSVDLPENCNYILEDDYLVELQIVSDIHVTTTSGATGEAKYSNKHFVDMLEDIKENSPNSIGIFVNGDIANTGSDAEYKMVYNLYYQEKTQGDGNLPNLHISIGNHDWMAGNPSSQFQKYAHMYNDNIDEQPNGVYYEEEVNGYHFIYLGGEKAGLRAALSTEQINWFDETLAKITKEDSDKPVFVFLHQSFYNTVAGSLPGQGWDGVVNETALKKVLKKYENIILLNGHSHWILNSEGNMFEGDDTLPVAFNTSSVSYLWTSYNVIGGEHQDGSEGYYVRVYNDKVVFLGRDFENSKFMPSAMYVVQQNEIQTSKDEYNISLNEGSFTIDAEAIEGGILEYTSSNTQVASVTEDGTVIPKKNGSTTITISSKATDTKVISRKVITVNVGEASIERIAGENRADTAFKIANELKETLDVEKFESIIVATGANFADALSGTYLATVKNAPIIMTYGNNTKEVQDYIKNNVVEGGTVYLLGGVNAIDDSVVDGLNGYMIERLWGQTRYETNLEILKEAGVTNEDILVATGTNFADSLSASASGKPILLVNPKTGLDTQQEAFLDSIKGNNVYIIGGEKAIDKAVEDLLINYGTVKRIAGTTRYETSVLVAKEFFKDVDKVSIASAWNYPDGLCGGALAYALNTPLILTADNGEIIAKEYVSQETINKAVVYGGQKALSNSVIRTLFDLDSSFEIVEK